MTYMELSPAQRKEALQRFERCVTWDPSAFAYTVDRAGHIATMKRRRAEVARTISQLIAEEQLDGVDHGTRLGKLRTEQAQLEETLSKWPAVEAELQRRLTAARQAVAELEKAELLQELDQLRTNEDAGRRAFADLALQFVETAATLKRQLDRKIAIKAELLQRGKGVDVGDPELPVFYPGWLRSDGGLIEAQRTLARG